jgi:hypothetical protein
LEYDLLQNLDLDIEKLNWFLLMEIQMQKLLYESEIIAEEAVDETKELSEIIAEARNDSSCSRY